MSDYLSNIFTTIAGDIRSLFSKFDTNGKLIKANLPALTKEDVGLSDVDNTADSRKEVFSAVKLATIRKISLIGGVTGYANFDGTFDSNIATVLNKLSVREAFGGYDVVASKSSDTLVRNFAVGSKMTAMGNYQSDAPFSGFVSVVETFTGVNSNEKLQIAYPVDNYTTVTNINNYSGQRLGFVYRRFPISNPTADQLRWIPISSSFETYKNTTSLPPNVYIDVDGVLRRSTYAGSAPVLVKATLGDPTNGLNKSVAHGLNASKISNVYARCNVNTTGGYNWFPAGFILSADGTIYYNYYYTVRAVNSILYIEVHPDATQVHGKSIDIFIETTT